MKTYSAGCTPDEVITECCRKQCPNGYPMVLKSQDDWTALSEAWNQGIDSHLEAMARSTADAITGRVLVHPDELATLCRRLWELDAESIWEDWRIDQENYPNESLRDGILTTLDIEEI